MNALIMVIIISLLLNLFLAGSLYLTKDIVITKNIEVVKKDPNGFIKQDMIYLRKHLGNKQFKVGDSLPEVAFNAGQHSVVEFIDTNVIGRRSNA